MDFKELLQAVRRRWVTVVVFVLLSLVGAGLLTYSQTPQYQSTARIFVTSDTRNSTDGYFASAFMAQRVKSYAQLATSRELMQRVNADLDLNMTPSQLASKISASVNPDTVILDLVVTDPSATVAQQIAKAESEELAKYLPEVETPSGSTTSPTKATIVDPASYSSQQVSPRPAINLIVAGMLGLLVGVAAAVARELLDNTVSSSDDVEATIDAPILASIAYDKDVAKQPLLTSASSHSPRVESFRLLRTNLQFLDLDTKPRTLVITSAVAGEGKTSTATNLAIALAQTGLRVLLVDADLRRPKAATVLGLERSVGLTTVLVGRSELQGSIQKHSDSGIYFLASGPIPPNPTEVLQSQATQTLFDRLSDMFDMVIIDAPPLLPVSDAAIMARDVDGAILVTRHGKTTKDQLRQAGLRLSQVNATLFGVAVNMAPQNSKRGYGYGSDYGYSYEPKRAKTK